MTPLRRCRSISALVALLTMAAWMIASNHCAFASLERPTKAEHACCHDEKSSSRPALPPALQCCEAFNVPVPEHVTAPVGHFFELPLAPETGLVAVVPAPVEKSLPACAHGPPRALGFVELVLGRSLLAHAPPAFVA